MGIKGLHPHLESATKPLQLAELRGQTLCADGHAWLHRGAVACARELAEGIETTQYAHFVVERVRLLARNGVRCVVVFDGPPTAVKQSTDEARRFKREKALAEARACDDEVRAAKLYAKTVSVTTEMVRVTIMALREAQREDSDEAFRAARSLVAPGEADPQLAALCVTGVAHGIVSEDSDIFVYLALCSLADAVFLMKLDKNGDGHALRVRADSFSYRSKFGKALRALLRAGESGARMVVQTCVLAGCDYVDAIDKVGPVTAIERVLGLRARDHDERLERLGQRLAPQDPAYVANVRRAEAAFYFAPVWDALPPSKPRCVPLRDLLPPEACCPPCHDHSGPSVEYDDLNCTHRPIVTPRVPLFARPSQRIARQQHYVDPDAICPHTLRELPSPYRRDIERQMILSRNTDKKRRLMLLDDDPSEKRVTMCPASGPDGRKEKRRRAEPTPSARRTSGLHRFFRPLGKQTSDDDAS